MKNRFFSIIFTLTVLLAISSCGDADDILLGGDQFTIDLVSIEDGDVLLRGQASDTASAVRGDNNFIFFRIEGDPEKNTSITLTVELFNPEGTSLAKSERKAPPVNSDLPVEIPGEFPDGEYGIVLMVMKADVLLSREERTFFIVSRIPQLFGIQSFPLVIQPAETALLIAEVGEVAGLNPYLRWTRGNSVIATGLLSDGYDQILWESPAEEGVYSVSVELFPFPPLRGSDYLFGSRYNALAELYITPKDQTTAAVRTPGLYYDLFDIYISALRERERIRNEGQTSLAVTETQNMTRPYPVIYGDTIAMRFNGQAGFICPDLIFPIKTRPFKPFTLSLGMTLEGEQAGRQILRLTTDDQELVIDFFFSEKSELILRVRVKTEEFFFPSGISGLQSGVYNVVDFSISEQGTRMQVRWRLNGTVVSEVERATGMTQGEKKGYTVIGGANGIRCIVDKLDILIE